jgi:hypothetical protein
VLLTDEQAPLGSGTGESVAPARHGGGSVSPPACFLRKFLKPGRCSGSQVSLERNPQGRMRVNASAWGLGVPAAGLQHVDRAFAFETSSSLGVRAGIDVAVKVADSTGVVLG